MVTRTLKTLDCGCRIRDDGMPDGIGRGGLYVENCRRHNSADLLFFALEKAVDALTHPAPIKGTLGAEAARMGLLALAAARTRKTKTAPAEGGA